MIFFSILIGFIALLALLLIVVVLLQSGKGGGLAGIAGGGATREVLGARQAPNLLQRATWTLAALFITLCILTNFAIDEGTEEAPSTLQDSAQPQQQQQPQQGPASQQRPTPGSQQAPGSQQQPPGGPQQAPQQGGGGQ